MHRILCRKCGEPSRPENYHTACPECSGPLHFDYGEDAYAAERSGRSMWRYRPLLPVSPGAPLVTLGEGGTPLIHARSEDRAQVFIKNESLNPTGSHKDRALSIGVSKALEFGIPAIMLYSDGSVALSAAAYAARAGLRCVITFGRGAAEHRLLPLMVYGAHLLEYQGTPDEALAWVHATCRKQRLYEASTYRLANPYEAEAPRTIGFEIAEQMAGVPDWIVCPAGGGGTIAGIFKAFSELRSRRQTERMPRVAAVVPEGYTAFETALARGASTDADLRAAVPRQVPATLQVKSALAYPPDGVEALQAVRESGGTVVQVSDGEALAAQAKLGAADGIYAEPTSAGAVAGLGKLIGQGKVGKGERVVVVVTGSGYRETGAVAGRVELRKVPVDGSSGAKVVEQLLEG
jgi:threonine synthase